MWASFRHLTVASPCRVCLAEVYQDKALVGEFMNRKCNYEDPKVGPARWSDSARPGDWDCWVPVWPTRSPGASAGLTDIASPPPRLGSRLVRALAVDFI